MMDMFYLPFIACILFGFDLRNYGDLTVLKKPSYRVNIHRMHSLDCPLAINVCGSISEHVF